VLTARGDVVADVPYRRLRHFGAVNAQFRLLYKAADDSAAHLQLTLPARAQATQLIASYLNAIIEREGVACPAAEITQLVP
jgi:hypothetical protein